MKNNSKEEEPTLHPTRNQVEKKPYFRLMLKNVSCLSPRSATNGLAQRTLHKPVFVVYPSSCPAPIECGSMTVIVNENTRSEHPAAKGTIRDNGDAGKRRRMGLNMNT